MEKRYIYLVASYTDTFIGRLIRWRAKIRFWDRYEGDCYSHVSLAISPGLGEMMSFARKRISNPFVAGLIKESIKGGMFAKNSDRSYIAVMRIEVTEEEYQKITQCMEQYWNRRTELHYNFAGLFWMMLFGRGKYVRNCYFCSQWCAEVLDNSGVEIFPGEETYNIKPFDFYRTLKENIVYEGLAAAYKEQYVAAVR